MIRIDVKLMVVSVNLSLFPFNGAIYNFYEAVHFPPYSTIAAHLQHYCSTFQHQHKKCSWHVILRPTIEESEREAVGGWCVLNLSCVLKSLKLLYIDGVVLEHLYY